jgi:VWFA-related protein
MSGRADERIRYTSPVTSLLVALTLITASSFAPSPQTPAAQAQLRIDVVAVDSAGAPVTDLKPSEFEVWIAGYRVPIDDVTFVTPDEGGRVMVLLLDNMAAGPVLMTRIKEAARAVIRQMSDSDRLAVVPLQGDRTELTGDRARLLRAVEAYTFTGFPFRIEDAGANVLGLLTALSRQMIELPGGVRKPIVAIGAGWMFDTPLPPPNLGTRDLRQEWLTAMRAMAAANTCLYVIDPSGVGAAPYAVYGGAAGFARETGGYAFMNVNDAAGTAARIWKESGTYYLLRVADPPVQKTADLRELEVKVLRKGVTLRVRRGIPGRR